GQRADHAVTVLWRRVDLARVLHAREEAQLLRAVLLAADLRDRPGLGEPPGELEEVDAEQAQDRPDALAHRRRHALHDEPDVRGPRPAREQVPAQRERLR